MKATDHTNQLGIWMDHSSAKLVHENGLLKEIHSDHVSQERFPGESGDGTRLGNFRSTNNEAHKHNKEINELHGYFNKIYEALTPYSDILIFGPTTAHDEFANYVIEKHKHFPGKISLAKSDYLSENKLLEFVRNHFSVV